MMNMQNIEYVKGINSLIEIKSHGNKKTCNKNMLEVNPTIGCQYQCQYCNAYAQEGDKFNKIEVYVDYPEYLDKYLFEHKNELDKIFFYFSPKIEAFQECLLKTGITYSILKLFYKYNARYIIVTKSGIPNSDVCSIIKKSRHLNQFLISCSMPNEEVRKILEPYAPPIDDRLAFAKYLVDNQIRTTAIFSPILPIDKGRYIKEYIRYFLSINITHFRLNYAELSHACLYKLAEQLPQNAEELKKIYLKSDAEKTKWQIPYSEVNINRYFPSVEYMYESFEEIRSFAKKINNNATFSVCNSLCEKKKFVNFNLDAFKAGFGCIGYRW